MKIPDVNIPITAVCFPWEVVAKAERAAERVWERMYRASAALAAAEIPFVVIGGNAVGLWVATKDEGAVRNTRDVDILMERRNWPRAVPAMASAGFDAAEADGMTVFLDRDDPVASRGVHVHYCGERFRPNISVIAPSVSVGLIKDDVPVFDLRELLILKLAAFRNIDRVHIRDMLKVGLIDNAVADQIPRELQPRMDEIRANPNG